MKRSLDRSFYFSRSWYDAVIMDEDLIEDEGEPETGLAEEATEDDLDLDGASVDDLPY